MVDGQEDELISDVWSASTKEGLCIGIDLGTTNSCVGIWRVDKNRVKILRNFENSKITPSVVSLIDEGTSGDTTPHVVGVPARDRCATHPKATVTSVKRLIGKRFSDPEVQKDLDIYPCRLLPSVEGDADSMVRVEVVKEHSSELVSPEHVYALLLKHLRQVAEHRLGAPVLNAVLTVPVHFSQPQRECVHKAARTAGFKHLRTLAEPTAAAMAYGLFVAGSKTVLVFDMGGGTLDVSVISVNDGKFKVLGVGSDEQLGGDDIDALLLRHVRRRLLDGEEGGGEGEGEGEGGGSVGRALQRGSTGMGMLRQRCETAKCHLSEHDEAELQVADILTGAGVSGSREGGVVTVTKAELEGLIEPLLKRCEALVLSVLRSCEPALLPEDVAEVALVGGSTRIPALRARLSALFGGQELCCSLNPEEVVAEGAAIQAALISGVDRGVLEDVMMMDVLPHSLGLRTDTGGDSEKGDFEVVIPRNTSLPAEVTKYFSTFEDNQEGLTVEVFEGESQWTAENSWMGYFNFVIPRSKRGRAGAARHPVSFTLNSSGVLQVRAGVQHSEEEECTEGLASTKFLVLYIVMLFVVYVSLRLAFPRLDHYDLDDVRVGDDDDGFPLDLDGVTDEL